MHPAHAVERALASRPSTARDLVAAITPKAELEITWSTTHHDLTHPIIDTVRHMILAQRHAAAQRLQNAPGWNITWAEDEYFLYGHLFARPDGREPDPTSPLILVNRFTLNAVVGPELADLARRVLADTLASTELRTLTART